MSPSPSNNIYRAAKYGDVLHSRRGFSLLEVVIAIFLTSIAVLAIMSLQPAAWKTAGRSDYMGRAAGILHEELQTRESFIMNCCNTVTAGCTQRYVCASGQIGTESACGSALSTLNCTAPSGDAQFTVTTTITSVATSVWRVTVRVAWTGHAGISESLVVTRQQPFSFPAGCSCV